MSDNKTVSCVIRDVVHSIYGGEEEPDLSLVLNQNFLLNAGSTMGDAALNGPTLTFTRASTGTNFDENGLLVTAAANEPRFDHDPGNSDAPLGLLKEPASTNEGLSSEDFSSGNWPAASGTPTVTANNAVAPDGNTTADNINDNNGSVVEQIQQTISGISNNETWCCSIFVKKDSIGQTTRYPAFQMRFNGGTFTRVYVALDTQTGEVATDDLSGTGVVEGFGAIDAGDYWRVWLCFTNNATGNNQLFFNISPAYGAGTFPPSRNNSAQGSIDVWGFQAEEGADYPTSYIPTTGSAVTRAKDVISTTDMTWNNANEGTLFVSAQLIPGASEQSLFCIDDGTLNDRIRLYADAAENINFETINSADTNGASNGAAVIPRNTVFKAAGAYADDDVIGCVDGALSPQDTSAALPVNSAATTARFGEDSAGATELHGHIREIKFWNERKPDSFLQSETT